MTVIPAVAYVMAGLLAKDPCDEHMVHALHAKLKPGMSLARGFQAIDAATHDRDFGHRPYSMAVICDEWDFSVRRGVADGYALVTRRFSNPAKPIVDRSKPTRDEVLSFLKEAGRDCNRVSLGIGSRWGLEFELDSEGRIEAVSEPHSP